MSRHAENIRRIAEEAARAKIAKLRESNANLRAALQKAIDAYGKSGGPWNVPSEPGTWITMAREAMKFSS